MCKRGAARGKEQTKTKRRFGNRFLLGLYKRGRVKTGERGVESGERHPREVLTDKPNKSQERRAHTHRERERGERTRER